MTSNWLQDRNVVPPLTKTPRNTPLDQLLERYHDWLVEDKCLAARAVLLRALACSAGAHLDAARLLLWCARQPQREHTLFQLGLNAGGIDLLRQLELPEEVC